MASDGANWTHRFACSDGLCGSGQKPDADGRSGAHDGVFGATQDIALDAFRIESGSEEKQAAFAATYQTGYRLAMIWAGAGALAIAAFFETQFGTAVGWRSAYLVMSASMLVGVVTVLLSPEPEQSRRVHAQTYASKREWIFEAICKPFLDFFSRFGWGTAVILTLIATYRISDVVMGVMANPFYADLGFSKEEVAAVSKVFGLIMTLVGAFAGGAIARASVSCERSFWAACCRLRLICFSRLWLCAATTRRFWF